MAMYGDVMKESGLSGVLNAFKDGAAGNNILDNRSLGGRLESAGRRAWNHGDMTQAGRIGMMAGGAAAVGGIGYGVAQGAQNQPLGTGAAVIGAAVALSLRPSALGGKLERTLAKDVAASPQITKAAMGLTDTAEDAARDSAGLAAYNAKMDALAKTGNRTNDESMAVQKREHFRDNPEALGAHHEAVWNTSMQGVEAKMKGSQAGLDAAQARNAAGAQRMDALNGQLAQGVVANATRGGGNPLANIPGMNHTPAVSAEDMQGMNQRMGDLMGLASEHNESGRTIARERSQEAERVRNQPQNLAKALFPNGAPF